MDFFFNKIVPISLNSYCLFFSELPKLFSNCCSDMVIDYLDLFFFLLKFEISLNLPLLDVQLCGS